MGKQLKIGFIHKRIMNMKILLLLVLLLVPTISFGNDMVVNNVIFEYRKLYKIPMAYEGKYFVEKFWVKKAYTFEFRVEKELIFGHTNDDQWALDAIWGPSLFVHVDYATSGRYTIKIFNKISGIPLDLSKEAVVDMLKDLLKKIREWDENYILTNKDKLRIRR